MNIDSVGRAVSYVPVDPTTGVRADKPPRTTASKHLASLFGSTAQVSVTSGLSHDSVKASRPKGVGNT